LTTDKSECEYRSGHPNSEESLMNGMAGDPLKQDALTRLLKESAPGLTMLEALMTTGSVTDAAALCGVSQPTLTRAMVRWEEAAGTALFDRSRRRIELTGSGQELACAATAALETMRTALGGALADSESKRLVVASLQSLGQSVVVELIAAYLNENPAAAVRLVECASVEVCSGVRSGRYELGVVERPPELAGFTWHPLGRQSLSLVIPATGTHVEDERADLASFHEHPFVALDRRFHSRANADILCSEAGFVPNIVLECDDPARLRHYVGEGRGIAILPADFSINPRVRTLPIDSPSAVREFGLLADSQRPQSAAAKQFVASVLAVGQQYPGWADLLDC
jgi:DNA-binding transcriptional LysR family regulator